MSVLSPEPINKRRWRQDWSSVDRVSEAGLPFEVHGTPQISKHCANLEQLCPEICWNFSSLSPSVRFTPTFGGRFTPTCGGRIFKITCFAVFLRAVLATLPRLRCEGPPSVILLGLGSVLVGSLSLALALALVSVLLVAVIATSYLVEVLASRASPAPLAGAILALGERGFSSAALAEATSQLGEKPGLEALGPPKFWPQLVSIRDDPPEVCTNLCVSFTRIYQRKTVETMLFEHRPRPHDLKHIVVQEL